MIEKTGVFHNEDNCKELASKLAQILFQQIRTNNIKFFLIGDLGVGKSTFVRHFLYSLGYVGNIPSPTYSLVESYKFQDVNIHHLDLYRLSDVEELHYLGWKDMQYINNILFIEWPSKANLDTCDIALEIEHLGENSRKFKLTCYNELIDNLDL